MSCLFQLFKKKPVPPPPRIQSEIFSIPFFGPLPSTLDELRILEFEIGSRLFYLNRKSIKLYNTASQYQNKDDIKKALLYMRQRKQILDDISKLSLRRHEVQVRIYSIDPKIEFRPPLAVVQIK